MEEKNALKRDKKGRLLPGTPPGPGRPKGSSYVAVCREAMEEGGWGLAIELLKSKDKKLALEAAKFLSAYGYGKPPETINANLNQSQPFEELTNQEIEDILSDKRETEKSLDVGTSSEIGRGETPVIQTEPVPTKVD